MSKIIEIVTSSEMTVSIGTEVADREVSVVFSPPIWGRVIDLARRLFPRSLPSPKVRPASDDRCEKEG